MLTTISRMGSVLWMALQPSKTLVNREKVHSSQCSRGEGDPERRIILSVRLFTVLSATDPVQAQRGTEIKELHAAPGQSSAQSRALPVVPPGLHQQAASSHSLNWQLPFTRSLDGTSIIPEAVFACGPETLTSPEAGEKRVREWWL